MNVSPNISIIFVNYRSAVYLQKALMSLFHFEQDTDFFEVIVVNNDPTENTVLRALQKEYPFLLIESGANLGFGRASNLGATKARGAILTFINPDVVWLKRCTEEIALIFDNNQTIGVVGMALLTEDQKPEPWSAGRAPSIGRLLLNNIMGDRQCLRAYRSLTPVDWVSGGGLSVRKDLFSVIGGFDERFFLYFEDVDLCTEVRQRGFSVVRHPDIPLLHFGGKSKYSTYLQKKHFYTSQKQYFNKWRPFWERRMLSWFQFFYCRY